MAKLDAAAKKAATKGPTPGQGIPNARIPSVRPHRDQAHFGSQQGPIAPGDQLYPGTKRFTKIQQSGTGQG
jgi:hypothetical protein